MQGIPNKLKNLLSDIPDDLDLELSENELSNLQSGSGFEDIFIRARKTVLENEEEVLNTDGIDDSIITIQRSLADIDYKISDIREAINTGDSKRIDNCFNMFNRAVHGLKGVVFSFSALTIGDILHGVEDLTNKTTREINDFNMLDLCDFLEENNNKIKEYVSLIKNGKYEVEVNRNKKIITHSNIEKSLKTFEDLDSNLTVFLNKKSDPEVLAENMIELIEELVRSVNNSRYKNFLILTQEILKKFLLHSDFSDETKKAIIKKEKNKIADHIYIAKEMLNLIIKNNSNYFNIAISNSKNENVIKKKTVNDTVSIDVEILGNILSKLDEVKIENTQVENAIKTSEYNIKSSIHLIDNMSKVISFFESFSDGKIQALSNEAKKDSEMFDPLEMDNYTELQEKTKTIKEILIDLKGLFNSEEKNINIKKSTNKIMGNALQKTNETLMSTRLKTVKNYLSSLLINTVNSAAKELNKKIELEIIGDHLEVDSVLMEKLKEPLVHTLRNSVSHGIEEVSERIRAGKDETGKIIVNFKQKNGKLSVYISDNGAGINVRKVEKKAREKGIWSGEKSMTDQQAVDIICMPNFSTQDQANQVSGRGVGMDAVKNEIIKLNGRYDIVSKEGKGLNITIQIPTSLSNKDVLLVSCSKQKFAIPMELIAGTYIFEQSKLLECAESGRINIGGQDIDFRYLADLVGISADSSEKSECSYVLLLSETGEMDGGVRIAIAVEKISIEMVTQVPIKTIGRTLSNVPGVTATTVLSDGRAAFIYDPVRAKIALLKHYGVDDSKGEDIFLPLISKNKNRNENQSKGLVMIVDDSTTVRKHTVRFLEKNGYNHIQAVDGEDAKSKIVNVIPDLILLDVEMPKMDGFEFAQYLKESEKHKHIPIIMITSRTADKHKNKAFKLGVDDYMGKPFENNILLASIKNLLRKK